MHMQELAPQVALRQLALPPEHPMRYERGMANLRRILWKNGQPVWELPTLHMDRGAYLQEACRNMTAAEQACQIMPPQSLHHSLSLLHGTFSVWSD